MIEKIKNNAFARNSLILFVGTMGINVLNYVFHLAIGRMVSVEVYGEIESLTSFVNIVSVPAMALTMIATKQGACAKAEDDKIRTGEIIKYLNGKVMRYGLPLLLVAIALAPFFGDFLKIESVIPIIFIWLLMFVSFLSSINTGILQGWKKFADVSWLGIWGALAKLLISISLVMLGFSLNGAISGYLAGGVVSYVASVFFLRFIFKKTESDVQKETEQPVCRLDTSLIRASVIPMFLGSLSINILGNADMVLAKHGLDSAMAGSYGVLTITSKIIFFVTGIIGTILFSFSAEESHKKADTMSSFKKSFYLTAFVSVISIVFYFLFPNFILSLLFGSRYGEISHYLGWFAVLAVLFSFSNLILQYFLSLHDFRILKGFLIISILAVLSLFLFGNSIYAILIVMSMAQIAAIIVGVVFLAKNSRVLSKENIEI